MSADIWLGIVDGMNADELSEHFAAEEPADLFEQMSQADRDYLARPKQPMCGFCGGCHRHNPACVALTDGFLVKMPWGKHKGTPVTDTPREYLQWLIGRGGDLPGELKAEIERVLNVPTFEVTT